MGHLPAYAPMTAQLGQLPPEAQDELFGYEMKWDGVRALGYVEDGRLRLASRNGLDVTVAYPEIGPLAHAVGDAVVLDGEIVAFGARGLPSFEALQPRMHQRDPARIRLLARAVPVTYLIFDILHLGDATTIRLPYAERRELLERTVVAGERWDVPPHSAGGGATVFATSRELLLEGVVAKRLSSPYRPGRRSRDWLKIKHFRTQDVVVGGWKPGEGRRAEGIGSLLLGVHDDTGRLVFAGHVGTGFTEAMLAGLAERLAPLARAKSPFDDEVPREHARHARWVEPVLVGEVRYAEWTGDGRLRHPSWRGLRPDRRADDVVREPG
ncbi:non-homologous end-joining DNA ligase [Microtetraspora sp. AC03309]|uniref:non-homologous end-joining DNA ligase n=1 Tax=Microtetraspora sp. AC03309 TaxID=2779376 RepID=UPI001E601099|nr:non-homologous end-joining DNA ligase [Microtetraspora sp. AC03309]MCC5579372.1 non-homologous end-joining DNA ligase [Microtetraspora sp. AC03309]